jgi:predicted dehydrogenase
MIRIGIVGLGHLGRIHLQVLKDLTVHFRIAGVFDHNKDRMRELQSENPQYAIFSSYQELLLNGSFYKR